MESRKFFYSFFQITTAVVCLTAAFMIKQRYERPIIIINKQSSSLNLNQNLLNFINLGNKRLLSSLIWTMTILESDTDHYKKKDLNSWMYIRFKTIATLEPKFLPTYTFGGPYLSIIKDDLIGASNIYNLGLQVYPDNYELLKNAAFHFNFEVKDKTKSYILYQKLKSNPQAKPILLTQLAKLEINHGNLEIAFQLLKDQYDSLKDVESPLKTVIRNRMYSIRAEIDLDCLNNSKPKCNRVDIDGEQYIYQMGKFKAVKEWKPFR